MSKKIKFLIVIIFILILIAGAIYHWPDIKKLFEPTKDNNPIVIDVSSYEPEFSSPDYLLNLEKVNLDLKLNKTYRLEFLDAEKNIITFSDKNGEHSLIFFAKVLDRIDGNSCSITDDTSLTIKSYITLLDESIGVIILDGAKVDLEKGELVYFDGTSIILESEAFPTVLENIAYIQFIQQ